MGRGDKRSKKGKRWRGSFGVSRPKTVAKQLPAKAAEAPAAKATKES